MCAVVPRRRHALVIYLTYAYIHSNPCAVQPPSSFPFTPHRTFHTATVDSEERQQSVSFSPCVRPATARREEGVEDESDLAPSSALLVSGSGTPRSWQVTLTILPCSPSPLPSPTCPPHADSAHAPHRPHPPAFRAPPAPPHPTRPPRTLEPAPAPFPPSPARPARSPHRPTARRRPKSRRRRPRARPIPRSLSPRHRRPRGRRRARE